MVKHRSAFAFNTTCIGASHLKSEKPCQDYSASWYAGKVAIIAVADGHGAADYFRSDRGARFAAEAAIECIKDLIMTKNNSLSNPSDSLAALEKSIITVWHKKITKDLGSKPINGTIIVPYGTTLLAAAITGYYWFAIQIGDGKCVIINKDNNISQPVPWDERCFLNQTTSLCDDNACDLFRHFYSETLPEAIFLGSDGIDDSFPMNRNEEHLARFYESIYVNFISEGLQNGKVQLREMLPALTQKGSGDDVSITGILRNIKQ